MQTTIAFSCRNRQLKEPVPVSTIIHSKGYTYTQYGNVASHQKTTEQK